MVDIEAHRHTYRSPIAAIIGIADAALLRDSLDADLVKHLRAIRALAQQALEQTTQNNPGVGAVALVQHPRTKNSRPERSSRS